YTGQYGKVVLDANGQWTYTLDQSKPAVTGLNDGGKLTDTVKYFTEDGTVHSITVAINGQSLPSTAGINGLVFKDMNDNGVREAGDTGIAGVGVQLRQPDGTLVAETTTDANGAYSFKNLAAGQYVVDFVEQSAALNGLKLVSANQGNNTDQNSDVTNTAWNATGTLTLAQGQVLNHVDAGYSPPQQAVVQKGTVSGTVWNDTNNDGIHQAGEAGVAGVTVDLRIAGGTTSVGTTTTDAQGNYSFKDVAAGNYFVDFAEDKGPLVGRNFASGLQGGDHSVDSDVTNYTAGWTGNFALPAGGSVEHIDAGIRPLPVASSVSGSVWNDANNDGIRQDGESGIAGVTVDLRIAGTRTSVATVTTDEKGNYTFSNVKEGNYFVDFAEDKAPLVGRSFTAADQGSDDARDSDVTNAQIGFTNDFSLKTGQAVEHLDAGIRPASSVSGSVWNDTNNDGIRQAGEAGVAGVTVDLRTAGTINSVATVTTDASGNYTFDNVREGKYFVDFAEDKAPLIGRNFVSGLQGSDASTDSDVTNYAAGWTHDITVAPGASVQHIDAGIRPIVPNSVSGKVWLDGNNDGQVGSGEKGLGGVTAVLYTTDASGNAMQTAVATTTTAADGSYTFSNVAPGRYFVDFNESQLPSGVRFHTGGTSDVRDNSNSGWSAPFTLSQGQQVSIDAAASENMGSTIKGIVWQDAGGGKGYWAASQGRPGSNNGHLNDNEIGVTTPGMQVDLVTKDGRGENIYKTTYLDSRGEYRFEGVTEPGTYYIMFNRNAANPTPFWMTGEASGDTNRGTQVTGPYWGSSHLGYTDVFRVSGQGGEVIQRNGAYQSPIALDLNNDGQINTAGLDAAGHAFDLLGTGDKVHSGWLAKGDGFLVIDTNHNGKIDSINEMFGGALGAGFGKLAKYDTNGDGYINVHDAEFGTFKVWVDTNGDRITDPGELKTLAEVGIVALKVSYEIDPSNDGHGNIVIEKSTAIMANGHEVLMGDVYFQVDMGTLSEANLAALAKSAAESEAHLATLTDAERAAIAQGQADTDAHKATEVDAHKSAAHDDVPVVADTHEVAGHDDVPVIADTHQVMGLDAPVVPATVDSHAAADSHALASDLKTVLTEARPMLEELAENHGFIASSFDAAPLMADVFTWASTQIGDPGEPHVTVIPDFNAAAVEEGGDVLNLKDLLQPADQAATQDLSQFLHFEKSDEGTVIHISQSGGFAQDGSNVSSTENLQIVLQNVDLTHSMHGTPLTDHQIINDLMKVGKLVTDL
ncbi:SdrD B-like domain-containing protein, partial [Amphibiibacter pelophylacis]